jgi:hypothetical protein
MCKKSENQKKNGGSGAWSIKIMYIYGYVQNFRVIYEVLSKQWHFEDWLRNILWLWRLQSHVKNTVSNFEFSWWTLINFDQFCRAQLSSYTERPWWELCCKWSKLVRSVSRSLIVRFIIFVTDAETIQLLRVNYVWPVYWASCKLLNTAKSFVCFYVIEGKVMNLWILALNL